MGKIEDLSGNRYGKLVVVEKLKAKPGGHTLYLCHCDCGGSSVVASNNLKGGHTKSCGCNKLESITTHGNSGTRIYNIYYKIKDRCLNPKNKFFGNYGGRGIAICQEWLNDFSSFYSWSMSNGYSDNLTIDRIDVNGNYEPSNCRWVSRKVQSNNTRKNTLLTYNGKTKTISEWAEETGICYNTLRARLRYGWSVERTLTRSVKK